MPTARSRSVLIGIFAVAVTVLVLGGCPERTLIDELRAATCTTSKPCELDINPSDATQKHHVMFTAGSEHKSVKSAVLWCYSGTDLFTVSVPDESPLDPSAALTSSIDPSTHKNCLGPIKVTGYAKSSAKIDGYKYMIAIPNLPPIDPHIIVVGGSS